MSRRSQLADVLSEFARTMMTDFPIQTILDRLVERIVDILPVTGAGVTMIADGTGPRYVAASSAAALRAEHLQSDLAEGPCLLAFRTGEPVSVPDLARDRRFPVFASRAAAGGLSAAFAFPLGHRGALLGALDLYRDRPGPLGAGHMTSAQTLADVAAAYLLNSQARTELTVAAERFRHSSLHDDLTGLPNRSQFVERLRHAVQRARGSQGLVAVLYADLDGFKRINDLYGHDGGDELLVAFARRLSAALRPGDTLGRLSGDEFLVLCEGLVDVAHATGIVDRLTGALRAPFVLAGVEVNVTASVGVSFAGEGGEVVAEEVIRRADAAMYEAKRGGGGRHVIRLPVGPSRPAGEASLAHDVDGAVARGELYLEYQPIVGAVGLEVVGVEALVRWRHPERGIVSPSVFVPLAEQGGSIGPIGAWVLRQACMDRGRWPAAAGRAVALSVNVSALQLVDADFPATVAAVLAETRTAAADVVLEVTETAFLRDGDRALAVLLQLEALGVALALDDFGTGFSSLSHLNRFPVDIVKIDRSFVASLGSSAPCSAIVVAVAALAHALGITATAEGVETAAQHRRLVEIGVDACQGHLFAPPMGADDLVAFLRGR